jgi:hypothetical protein
VPGGTVPPQSLGDDGSDVAALRLLSGSVPVLVTTTRQRMVVVYTVADESQSAALPGSHEVSTASTHTWTSADIPAFGSVVPDEIVALALDVPEVTFGPEGGVPVALAVLVVAWVTSSLWQV